LSNDPRLFHTRGVEVLNDPQIWTVIAAFLGLQVYSLRHFDQRLDGLRAETLARFEQVDRRFEQVDRRFDEVDRRFDEVDRRFGLQDNSIDNRFDQQTELINLRFGALEHRVAALEDDMKLVKAHLIPPAA